MAHTSNALSANLTADINKRIVDKFGKWGTDARSRVREITFRKFDRFFRSPSESVASQIEESLDLPADWSDADHGEGMKR